MTMPLEGIRVIELNRVAPGSLCTMILGDMGAEVIRIEAPEVESTVDSENDSERIAEFVNRNKKTMGGEGYWQRSVWRTMNLTPSAP